MSLPLESTFPIEFLVYGTPMSWQAKRAASKLRWKTQVREACGAVLPEHHFATQDALAVTLFFLPKDRESGDIDNIIKLVLDALCGHLYLDDAQVERILAQRFTSSESYRLLTSSERLVQAVAGAKPVLYVRVSNDPLEDFR